MISPSSKNDPTVCLDFICLIEFDFEIQAKLLFFTCKLSDYYSPENYFLICITSTSLSYGGLVTIRITVKDLTSFRLLLSSLCFLFHRVSGPFQTPLHSCADEPNSVRFDLRATLERRLILTDGVFVSNLIHRNKS